MPVASRSHVLAAYASFLWEQDDDLGEGEQGTGGAGAPDQRAATTQQAGQVSGEGTGFGGRLIPSGAAWRVQAM